MPQTTSPIDLSELCMTEKCHLLALLATWQQQVLDDEDTYELRHAAEESLYEVTADVQAWLSCLQSAPHADARLIMWRLATEIKQEGDEL